MRFSRIITSRIFVGAALAGTMSLMSTAAFAGCNSGGTYCTQNSYQGHNSGYSMLRSANPISTYSSYSSYSAPIAVADQPAAVYAYEGGSYSTGSAYSLDTSSSNSWTFASGLGYSAGSASDVPAGMCPATCPVSVDAPAGSRVLACYQPCPQPVVVQPEPIVQAYQVVRPIVAIPYAVPVMVPNTCGPIVDAPSRYGSRYGYGRCGY